MRRAGRRLELVAVADNGRQQTVLSRDDPKVLAQAEDDLLHALARRRGMALIRHEAWQRQVELTDRALAQLRALRDHSEPGDTP